MTKRARQPILPSPGALGLLSSLVAARGDVTRADLIAMTGHSRVTVGQKLLELFEAGVIVETDQTKSSGGRPIQPITLNRSAGLIASADVGESHIHYALSDLNAKILVDGSIPYNLRQSPEQTLSMVAEGITNCLGQIASNAETLIGLGISIHAPLNFKAGTVEGPSVMAGWDNFDIRGYLGKLVPVPIVVDNDVNLLAMSEASTHADASVQIAFIKVGTGIGCGIIGDQKVFRGANGAAGDIGHIQLARDPAPLCRCGKLGCVEAHAGGWAIARDLREAGFDVQSAGDAARLVRENVPEAVQLVRRAGRIVGEVAADLVSILNPDAIIVGGIMAETGDHFLSGVREIVYQRCLSLATRKLTISMAAPNPLAGLHGAALLVRETAFSPENVGLTVKKLVRSLSEAG